MGKVNVVIVDATGNKEQKVGLPDDIKCGIIMVKLVEKIKLPSVGPDGNPISYKFIHKVTGRQLLETQTLGEAGIKDGDVLRLQPEITAGAICPHCGMDNPDGNTFCQKCGKNMSDLSANAGAAPNPSAFTPGPAVNNSAYNRLDATVKKNSKAFPVIGIISGALSILFGIIEMVKSTGTYARTESYGGDAYTGIQHASAYTANNVQDLAEICKFGIGALLIVLGLGMICYFAMKMSNS